MRGLDQVVEARRKGMKPPYVALSDTHQLEGWLGDIRIELTDVPELLDLRALVDLFVVVQGKDGDAVSRWADAAVKAGASTVIAKADGAPWRHLRLMGVDQ